MIWVIGFRLMRGAEKGEQWNNRSNPDEFKAEEPAVEFRSVRIYDTIDEMEVDELKWLAKLSPEEHIHHALSLIKRVYSEQLKNNPEIGKEINFDRFKF